MFESLQPLPQDPILQLMVHYRQDPNPLKVDLGIGVYKDDQGNTPIMAAVDRAERILVEKELTKSYIGPAGSEAFNRAISGLLLGDGHPLLSDGRLTVAQTPGGCGALRMAAEFLQRCAAGSTIWVSDPTWANHIPLLSAAGLQIREYPYYDRAEQRVRFAAMLDTLASHARPGDLVLLHGCCHNPSGADLTAAQWDQVAELILRKQLLPFVDIAYQGLGLGLDQDAYGVRLLADKAPELIVTASCSKNFGLYRERTGALLIASANAAQARNTASQLFCTIRAHYSMPPAHGAATVETILADPALSALWQAELGQMRERILGLRQAMAAAMAARDCGRDFSFITQQLGMFSFLGITGEQVRQLRDKYSVYMVDSSRINVAGLSAQNLDYVADALTAVLRHQAP